MANPLTIRPDRLERLRAICLAFPETEEGEAFGDPSWKVLGKGFASQKGNFEGGRPSVWFKAPRGEQEVLVGSDPGRFFVPPYVGAKNWVAMWLDAAHVDWDEVGELVEESYRLIAPKRLVATLRARPIAR